MTFVMFYRIHLTFRYSMIGVLKRVLHMPHPVMVKTLMVTSFLPRCMMLICLWLLRQIRML